MNLTFAPLLQYSEPLLTTVSSPKLDLIEQTWDHIADRYIARIKNNRIFAGRVRSILSLATYDALHSVIDPGNGHIFKEISEGSTIEAAAAAAVKASHDVLSAVFTDPTDQQDLADLLEESLALFGNEEEKRAGLTSGERSASTYIKAFSPLLVEHRHHRNLLRRPVRELAAA